MKILIIKSLLPSLCQREEMYPSLEKRGEGRFFNNDVLLMTSLVKGTLRYRKINFFSTSALFYCIIWDKNEIIL
ncbi:MAG: hypothetical protein AB1480_13630 [Nitrospirota bacterium]